MVVFTLVTVLGFGGEWFHRHFCEVIVGEW